MIVRAGCVERKGHGQVMRDVVVYNEKKACNARTLKLRDAQVKNKIREKITNFVKETNGCMIVYDITKPLTHSNVLVSTATKSLGGALLMLGSVEQKFI